MVMHEFLSWWNCHRSRPSKFRWQQYAGWPTGTKGARHTRRCPAHHRHDATSRAQKSACDEDWALLRLSIPTGQGRVADASATEGIYALGAANASLGALGKDDWRCRKPPTTQGYVDSTQRVQFGAVERSLIEVYEEQYGDRRLLAVGA